MPTKAKITAIIQNLITIVDSAHPFCSKWWCKGAILNILLPVSLNDKICTITDTVSNTKRPPIITNTNSCLDADAVTPITPPSDNEPVSPIKTIAGGALNHKKPNPDPIIAPNKTVISPTPGT